MNKIKQNIIIPSEFGPNSDVMKGIKGFLTEFVTFEAENGLPLLLLMDERSKGLYLTCHLESKVLASKTDANAVLDPLESEEYKLNRGIYTDNYAYKLMESDALKGRSFEDLVVEYDRSYRRERPLKVFGGQHRILAIKESIKNGVSVVHGVRAYFALSIEQRFDIATANNTSIAVSNDLLDRMQEDLLGPNLRDWCQCVGLLAQGQNFADRRSSEGIPTVRIARSIIVNYYLGKNAEENELNIPVVCKSGPGIDEKYMGIHKEIDWSDGALKEMGQEFTNLHKLQRERVLNRNTDKFLEFANKMMHPSVAASWAYAAGLFKRNPEALRAHYDITNSVNPPVDPLNAKALLKARLEGIDPDTYRGLGSRISGEEMGRMLQVFILQATMVAKRGITLKLANAAIEAYAAKKAQIRAEKAIKGL